MGRARRERALGPVALLPVAPAPIALIPIALGLVAILDAVASLRTWPVPIAGLLDEPAHLLTAWLFLTAVAVRVRPALRAWALAGAVLIDVDHIPLYLWDALLATPSGRPVTHSLLTVAVLMAVSGLPRVRTAARGLALGVLLHLARDLATGPGVPLLWPASGTSVRLAYPVYGVALLGVALLAGYRAVRRRRALVSD